MFVWRILLTLLRERTKYGYCSRNKSKDIKRMKSKQDQSTPMSKELSRFFASLSPTEVEKSALEISEKCIVAVSTVHKWRLGARNPKVRYEPIIRKYISNFNRKEQAQ